jgi:8-oxo-dGTP pyrophosphatase MutT (NUDIX family)
MKKPKFLYHGSGKRLEVLEPSQPTDHNPGHDKKGVYATDLKDMALGFSAKDSAKTSGFKSRKTNIHYIYEGWPDLNSIVYLHILDSKDFEYNAPCEYICSKKVKPIRIEEYRVSDLQHLFRKATKKDLKEFLKDRDAWKDPDLRNQKNPSYKFVIKWGKTTFDCEWSDDTDFEKLPSVNDVHGFVFDDKDRVCIVKWKADKHWGDLGGRIEKSDKTFEDTFIREVDEEADLDIKDLRRMGYLKFTARGEKTPKYGVKIVARVKKIKPSTIDPARGEIPERKFIDPKDINKYTDGADNWEFQIKKALEILK